MQRDLHVATAHIEAMLSLDEKNVQVKLNWQRHEHPEFNGLARGLYPRYVHHIAEYCMGF